MDRLPAGVRRAFHVIAPERRIADDVDDEVTFHIEMRTEDLVARGWAREAARGEALRRFGNVEHWRKAMGELDRGRTRRARRAERWHDLVQDFRYALRGLRRAPGFTAVVVLTLALGIGANTAVFSVVDAVLLRPLPYRQPERLVTVEHYYPSLKGLQAPVSAPGFMDYRDRTRIFEAVAVESPWRPTLTGRGEPERLQGARASGLYFPMLGVAAARGRTLRPDEDAPGRNRVVVVSDGFWRRAMDASPSAVGSTILLDGERYDVVGVMPPSFRDFFARDVELWAPLALTPAQFASGRTSEWLSLTARLRPGVTLERASAEMASFAEQLKRDFPGEYPPDWSLRTTPLAERATGKLRPTLLVLLGAVGFVLLIGCANVANLLLARASGRSSEVAIRSALGADRWQVVRPLFAESMLLALVGGASGLLLAHAAVHTLARLDPSGLPGARDLHVDASVMAFTLLVSLLTGLLFGLAPVLQTWRTNFTAGLKEGARGASAERTGRDVRRALVIGEIALALTLLVGAGLMIKSVARLQQVEPGFDPRSVLTVGVDLPETRFRTDTQRAAFFDDLLPRLAALPGVRAVGGDLQLPFAGGGATRTFAVEGYVVPAGQPEPWGEWHVVSPGFFQVLRVPLVRGRVFTERDRAGAPRIVIVDQELAQRYWPNDDPIGKRITFTRSDSTQWMEVVGVVGHVRQQGLDADPRVQFYVPYAQDPPPEMEIAVRTTGDPMAMLGAVRGAVRAVDAGIPLSRIGTMEQRLEASVGQRRLAMLLLTVFSTIALVLASVGIYGVMAYSVAQRSRELGVRIALGATRRGVLGLVMRQGMALVLGGIALGLLAAFALAQLLTSQLYGVPATDPSTFLGVALLLGSVAALATMLPALRATRVDPVVALRAE